MLVPLNRRNAKESSSMFYNHHKPVFDFSFFSSLQIIREKYNTELLVLRKYSQNLIEEINALV